MQPRLNYRSSAIAEYVQDVGEWRGNYWQPHKVAASARLSMDQCHTHILAAYTNVTD